MLGYLDTKFVEVMDDTVALLRQVFGTENRLTFPVSGTGTAGMEAALANIIDPGDGVVVGINGYFGERIANIATRCGGAVTTVETEWGTHTSALKELQKPLRKRLHRNLSHSSTQRPLLVSFNR